MKLHYTIVGSGQPLVILHGLFGSSDNWRGLAKQLSTHVQVITVDLRNHGYSPHSSEQSYQLMVEDLLDLLDELDISHADIVGHSIGGKVAMAFAQYHPDRVNKLLVVDIAPRQYSNEHGDIFEALLNLDLSQYSKRSEVDRALSTSLSVRAVRQFLLMNLDVSGQSLKWRINLQAIFDNYHNLLKPINKVNAMDMDCCFVRGGRSAYIQNEDEETIKTLFPQADIYLIEQAGHWVHADAPEQFLTKMTEFFDYD